jgi:hypothetical protein
VSAPTSTKQPDPSARGELRDFLDELRDLLEGTLTDHTVLFGSHASALTRAWARVSARFQVIEYALEGKTESGKSLAREKRAQIDRELEQHGLTGPELALKLEVFRSAVIEYLDEVDQQDEAERYWRTWEVRLRGSDWIDRLLHSRAVRRLANVRDAGRALLKRRLGRALEAGDVALDSLGQALDFIPGVGAAAAGIGEFKDATRVALGEPDDGGTETPTLTGEEPSAPPSPLHRLRRKLRWKRKVGGDDAD